MRLLWLLPTFCLLTPGCREKDLGNYRSGGLNGETGGESGAETATESGAETGAVRFA